MDDIVLDVNLKYVLATLEMAERGELLTALFEGAYTGSNASVKNVYHYISLLQQEVRLKKQHMRELSAKGVAARARKKNAASDDVSAVQPAVQRRSLRKEAKEDINLNKYNLNLFSFDEKGKEVSVKKSEKKDFAAPDVEQVRRFVAEHQLQVNAETFVNFYESHGWMVGSTPIKSWQATLKLWHLRATAKNGQPHRLTDADETYWRELEERVSQNNAAAQDRGLLSEKLSVSARQNLPEQLHSDVAVDNSTSSPFARFMRRVEKYDINTEKKHE